MLRWRDDGKENKHTAFSAVGRLGHYGSYIGFHCLVFLFQTKTYDSVTDKFMDFSFEKVRRVPLLFRVFVVTFNRLVCNEQNYMRTVFLIPANILIKVSVAIRC